MPTRFPIGFTSHLAAGLASLAFAMGCGSAPDTMMTSHGASAGGPLSLQLSETELQDLRTIAQQYEWTLAETARRIGWQGRFSEVVDELQRADPDNFAGAAITWDDPGQDAMIAFKGAVPVGLATDARLQGLAVDLRAERGYSERELEAQAEAVHEQLLAMGFADAATWVEIETGAVESSVVVDHSTLSPGLVGMSGSALADAVVRELPSTIVAPNVVIEVVDAIESGAHATLYGGSTTGGCTGAFAVNGPYGGGMSTAGHCSDSRSYRNRTGDTSWRSSVTRAQYEAKWGDFQYDAIASATTSPTFYSNWSSTRTATRIGNAQKGYTVCRFGNTTGNRCDTVRATSYLYGWFRKMIRMDHNWAEPGDSGGPWYYSSTAYGIHTGWSQVGIFGKKRDTFSQSQYIDDGLSGVSIKLGAPPPPPPPPPSDCSSKSCALECDFGVCINEQCVCDML